MAVNQDPEFTVQARRIASTAEVELAGELDIGTGTELARSLDDAFRASPERIVIDLRRVTFIDSSGLCSLLDAKNRANAEDLDVLVLRPAPPADRIFEICGVEDEFPRLGAADVG